jgi:GntR family transcriptional regulator
VIAHEGPETKCRQLARILAARIARGEFERRLPSAQRIAEEFRVSLKTVARAREMLRERNLVVVSPGRGTFVKANVETRADLASPRRLAHT